MQGVLLKQNVKFQGFGLRACEASDLGLGGVAVRLFGVCKDLGELPSAGQPEPQILLNISTFTLSEAKQN